MRMGERSACGKRLDGAGRWSPRLRAMHGVHARGGAGPDMRHACAHAPSLDALMRRCWPRGPGQVCCRASSCPRGRGASQRAARSNDQGPGGADAGAAHTRAALVKTHRAGTYVLTLRAAAAAAGSSGSLCVPSNTRTLGPRRPAMPPHGLQEVHSSIIHVTRLNFCTCQAL